MLSIDGLSYSWNLRNSFLEIEKRFQVSWFINFLRYHLSLLCSNMRSQWCDSCMQWLSAVYLAAYQHSAGLIFSVLLISNWDFALSGGIVSVLLLGMENVCDSQCPEMGLLHILSSFFCFLPGQMASPSKKRQFCHLSLLMVYLQNELRYANVSNGVVLL